MTAAPAGDTGRSAPTAASARVEGGIRQTAPSYEAAATALREGAVVAIPTDTVYGLAVDPSVPGATDRLFALKRRPARVDLPVLVASTAQADGLVGPHGLGPLGRALAEVFWPGALTMVVARREGLGWTLGKHERTIGVRCPASAGVRRLCEVVGPIATTSANVHGQPPCADVEDIRRTFGDDVAVVVDGGRCVGPSSTVVDVTTGEPRCVRAGAVAWQDVVAVAHRLVTGSR